MKRRGFTLIELLVVIAIISLLVSILLPSLSRAKDLARRAVCATNLRNIGTGLAMYLPDNQDRFPSFPHMNSEAWRWAGTLAYDDPATGDDRPDRPLNPYLGIETSVFYPHGSLDFAPDIAVLTRCPAETLEQFEAWGQGGVAGLMATIYRKVGNNYLFNAHGYGGHPNPNGLKGRSVDDVTDGSTTIAASDFGLIWVLDQTPDDRYLSPHNPELPAGNLLFVAGHVTWSDLEPVSSTEYWRGNDWTVYVP